MSTAMIMISCNKMDNVADSTFTDIPESKTESSMLSFDSEEDFWAAIQSLRAGMEESVIATKSTGIEDFRSLYDEYDQAMTEADEYYQRDGGYEEFKIKFPDLYYPEFGEDYAAFLPVSDEVVSKLLNTDGLVRIAGEVTDLRDVWSYEKILELGLGMPEYEDLLSPETKSLSDYITLTEEKQTVNPKRKAWVTLRGISITDPMFMAKIGRVDLCYRKKGILGWYNGKMTSESFIMVGSNRIAYNGGKKNLEYSPHKYVVATRPLSASSSNYGTQTFYFDCGEDDPDYMFYAKFTTNVDNLLDKNNGTGIGEDIAAFFNGTSVIFGISYTF